jgi:chemotaxis protein MotB
MSVVRRAARGLAFLWAVAALGCVSASTHERVVGELNQKLDAERASSEAERQRLAAESDALRQQRDDLEKRRADCDAKLAAKTRQYGQIQPTYEGLVRDLEAELAAAEIEIDQLREGLRMTLPAETLFGSGSADVTPEGERMLARIAAELKGAPYEVRVQGYTDDVAIKGALAERYPTNWELAGARAARVVRVLEAHGVDPARLAAVSLGDQHPVASNDTANGRGLNRRIELRLVPLPGARTGAPPPGFTAPPAKAAPPAPSAARPAPGG